MKKTMCLFVLVAVVAVISGCSKNSPVGPVTAAEQAPAAITAAAPLSYDAWLAQNNMDQATLTFFDSLGLKYQGMTYTQYYRQAYNSYVASQNTTSNSGSGCTGGGGGGGSVSTVGNTKTSTVGNDDVTTVGNSRNSTVGRN
ncbi:MAG: hypothetical protein WCI43_01395 [Candidatus Firestonebacteria bacterium]